MSNVKDALLRMVRAATLAKKVDEKMTEIGYSETPYFTIYSDIADAIYALIGENTERFEDSVTYTMLTAPYLDNERRAASLEYVFHKNNPMKPDTMEQEDMRKLYKKNGGYMSPEGDWS